MSRSRGDDAELNHEAAVDALGANHGLELTDCDGPVIDRLAGAAGNRRHHPQQGLQRRRLDEFRIGREMLGIDHLTEHRVGGEHADLTVDDQQAGVTDLPLLIDLVGNHLQPVRVDHQARSGGVLRRRESAPGKHHGDEDDRAGEHNFPVRAHVLPSMAEIIDPRLRLASRRESSAGVGRSGRSPPNESHDVFLSGRSMRDRNVPFRHIQYAPQ